MIGGLLPAFFFAKAPDAEAKRERLYPPVTLFWAFLFQQDGRHMICRNLILYSIPDETELWLE